MANLATRANNYTEALRKAARLGVAHGYTGAQSACPWTRKDYALRYQQGYIRGAKQRLQELRRDNH